MKTLKTLLALTLLVSSVAPSFAMENDEVVSNVEAPVAPAAPVEAVSSEDSSSEEVEPNDADSSEEATTEVTETGRLANAWASVKKAAKAGSTSAKNVLLFEGFNKEAGVLNNKTVLAKGAAAWTAITLAVTGAGYAVYSFFSSEEDEEEVEAPVVTEEPQVQTVAPAKAEKRTALRAKQAEVRKRNSANRRKRGGCRSCK